MFALHVVEKQEAFYRQQKFYFSVITEKKGEILEIFDNLHLFFPNCDNSSSGRIKNPVFKNFKDFIIYYFLIGKLFSASVVLFVFT